jgi:outer membrane protein TolC
MHCTQNLIAALFQRRTVTRAPIVLGVFAALLLSWPLTSSAAESPLTLEEALAIAVRDSSLLAAQRSAVGAAGETAAYARELPDPKLKLGIDNLPLDGPDKYNLTREFMTMRRIGVTQEFPRAEKREIKGRRAEHQLAREQALLGDARATLRRDVAAAWTERYYTEQMAKTVGEQYAETVLQRDALQAGVAAGRTTLAERLALDAALQMLLDRRAEFDKQAARAQAMLTRWLGEAARRPLSPLLPVLPSPENTAATDTHAPHHPHLQSLQRQIDIAQSEADLAKAATKPDWGVELSYAQRGPAYSNMLSLQVSIDLPLFADRRQNREATARAAQVEQARALREDALRQHLAEAAVAQVEWEAATARLKRFDDDLLPLTRDRTRLALASYRGGFGALSAVLEARRAELDLRLQKWQLAAEQGRAQAQLLYFLPEESVK